MGYVLEDNKVRFVYDKTTDLDIDAIIIEDLSGKVYVSAVCKW